VDRLWPAQPALRRPERIQEERAWNESFLALRSCGRRTPKRVGKKCANLGELTGAGFRVPPGYAVSLEGYARFMDETGVRRRIEEYLSSLDADPNKTADMPRFEVALCRYPCDG